MGTLDQGLRLMFSDHDVTEIVSHHVGHDLVELYIVIYGVVNVQVEERGFKI
jgi:hypothetical protein